MEIYFDNSATTPLSDAAREMMAIAADRYGNPSSLHNIGFEAQKLIDQARKSILSALGAKGGGELVFTSCGTEATSLALFGSAFAKERFESKRILTTDSEHPSVANALSRLEGFGFEVIRIPTKDGVLDESALAEALKEKVFLASFMMVNNESGALYDVARAFGAVKEKYPSAITHCDAVQGFLKTKFTPSQIHADLITLSGHKVHAPKGVGALYISKEMIKQKKIVPFLLGGGQENGMRSGTENVIGIAAFGGAVADIHSRLDKTLAEIKDISDYAKEKLSELDVKLNISKGSSAPHILSITLPNIKSETMLHFLSRKGIYVSSGSACSSHSGKPSSAMIAFGLTPKEADTTVRVSFSEYNTKEEVDLLTLALKEGIDSLVRINRR